jgi:hypothetical protein
MRLFQRRCESFDQNHPLEIISGKHLKQQHVYQTHNVKLVNKPNLIQFHSVVLELQHQQNLS